MRTSENGSYLRPAAVAGLFYPRDPTELDHMLDALLAGLGSRSPPPKVIVVPHAGYVYSGRVAAHAYAALGAGARALQDIVVLGPSHRHWFRGMAVPAACGFETPLGSVTIDAEARRALCELPAVMRSDAPHAHEHSLEVQLPFLQRIAPGARIVPVVAGDAAPGEVAAVIEALWGGPETLIVVSSDLSHYHPYDEARARDAVTAQSILEARGGLTGEQACGCVALNGLAVALGRRKRRAELLALCNSGDTAGDRQRVVGYGAFGFYDA